MLMNLSGFYVSVTEMVTVSTPANLVFDTAMVPGCAPVLVNLFLHPRTPK